MDAAIILRFLNVLEQLTEQRGLPKGETLVNKNVSKSENSTFDSGDKKKKSGLNSSDKKTLVETFNLFNQMFFDYQKKMTVDTKEKTKVSQIARRQATPPPIPQESKKKEESSKFGFGSILGGLLLLVGGLAAFIAGVMNNGPFKGILKILSKVGLSGGLKLLKGAMKPFIEVMSKLLKYPLKIIGSIGKFLGSGISKMFGKVTGKLGGGSIVKMIVQYIKPMAKIFKRIPVIGTIISIAFAYSRFKRGDVVGGVIDVLSGLAGLIDIVAPGVGTAMSIGLDVLNAVLDAKSDQGVGKPKKNKLSVLGDMAKSVGSWIWSKRMYIPILSSVNRFMMSWDDFKSGNIVSGFGNFGLALSNLVTGVDGKVIMDGISGFMGLFESDKGSDSAPKPSKSFISEMSDALTESIKELWKWIKNKIRDGIAAMVPGGKATLQFAEDAATATKELSDDIKNKSKAAYDKTKSFIGNLWKGSDDSVKQADRLKLAPIETKTNNSIVKQAEKTVTPDKYNPANKPLDIKNVHAVANMPQRVVVKSGTNIEALRTFYKLNLESNHYLKIIANNTALSISKMNNGSGNNGGGQTVVAPSQQQAQKTSPVSIDNNRMGFATSAYSLG